MATAARALGEFAADLATDRARNHRTVRDGHTREIALCANAALLDFPRGRFHVDNLGAGTYSVSFSQAPEAKYVWIRAAVGPGASGDAVTIDLTIRDATGNVVTSSSSNIPLGFKGETHLARTLFSSDRWSEEVLIEGYLDLEELDGTLTDPTWSLDFTVGVVGGGYVSRVEGWAVPRFLVDDSQTAGGVVPGNIIADAAITDSATKGLRRVLETIESARQCQQTLISLAWKRDTAAAIPQTTATGVGALTNLAIGSDPMPFVVLPRRIYAPSATGEAHRWRVLYRFAGGAGTETATVQTSAESDVPSTVSTTQTLSYTTSWTWSGWKTTGTTPTDGSDETVALTLEAGLSAAGPTLYIAGWDVEESVA